MLREVTQEEYTLEEINTLKQFAAHLVSEKYGVSIKDGELIEDFFRRAIQRDKEADSK